MVAAVAIYFLVHTINQKAENIMVPSGYKYVIEDHYSKSGNGWATYYIYDTYVLVKKDSEENKDELPMIYDGIDASKLNYDESDTTKICDTDSCYNYPKILTTIKKLIANKFGREYTGQWWKD